MNHRHALLAVGLAVGLAAASLPAQQNSLLDRGDLQLTTVQGVIQDVAGANFDVGFNQIDVVSPRNFVAAGVGGVATPQLVYALFPDHDPSSQVVLRVTRSTDGGRTWQAPLTVYTANTAGGEDLNTGDEGTAIHAWGSDVYVTFQTNAHNTAQLGQSLWVAASSDQGVTWSVPLNVSTGWNRPTGNRDWDVDLTRGAANALGLSLVWEADFEDPANPGSANVAPNNNENMYYARVGFSGVPSALGVQIPATALTSFAIGTFDVDDPSIAVQNNLVLIAWVDDANGGLAPGGNATLSTHSFDAGVTFSPPVVHSGSTIGTFPLAWAQQRRPWALLDGPFAFVIQEDSRLDEDDVWMDRGDIDSTNLTINWTVNGVMCNHTSTTAGSGDVDGIIAAAHNGVLAILYRDDSANTPLNNSNEAYLVVDRNFGNDFIAGTFHRHQVTTSIATIYDLQVVGNMVAGVFEACPTTNEEGGIVLSHDRGATIESIVFTSLGSCGAGTIDVDDLQLALSLNGDFNVIYADERLGGATATNANNVSWITGGKWPRLRYDATQLMLTMDRIDPNQSIPGGDAILMIALGTSPGVDVPAWLGTAGGGTGFFVGLTNDVFFGLMWVNVPRFLVGIGPGGTASWAGIPNATALLGFPLHIAGATIDWNALATGPLRSFTDAILQ